jgi:hypothetical protein
MLIRKESSLTKCSAIITALLTIFVVSSSCMAMDAGKREAICPGAVWRDTAGRRIEAHGGCIIKQGRFYYLFGEDRSRHDLADRRYVGCYKSTDLVHWLYCGEVVKLRNPDPKLLTSDWVLERPKVLYNRFTHRYVMYAHIDGRHYSVARVAVLISRTIDGHYHFLRSFRPLGHQSRDIGIYQAHNGRAYLLFEDRPSGFRIVRLSLDYLRVQSNICLIHTHLEALGLVHYQGLYYVMGSHLTGWGANPDVYATARSLRGPWSKFRNIAPPRTNTYNSQSGFLLKIVGTRHTAVIYMGDRWNPKQLWNSRYIWMPLKIGDGRLRLPEPRCWRINVHTGVVEYIK